MKITLLSLVLCLLCSLNMAAQGSDIGSNPEDTTIHQLSKKELRRRKVAKRNIHYNILGGPSYTPDFGALIGGSALVTTLRVWDNGTGWDSRQSTIKNGLSYGQLFITEV